MANFRTSTRCLLLRATLASVLAGAAAASWADVYKWVDAQGQTHYSDLPPDPGVNAAAIPLGKPPAPPPPAAPASPAASGSPDAINAKTAGLRGKMLGVEPVDNSPEAQRQRDEACQRMRTEATLLGGDNRVFTLDAKGERAYLDDDTRSARIAELQQQIAAGCK